MKKAVIFPVFFYILFLATTISAKDIWLETNSANFHIVGNVSESNLREVVLKLENFHNKFLQTFFKIKIQTPFPTKVVVFQDAQKFLVNYPFFLEGEDTNYISISLKQHSEEEFQRVFHDYTHFLIKNNLGQTNIPLWLNEGIAEYLTNSKNQNISLNLNENDFIPLNKLLEADYYTFQSQEEERKSLFIRQSWAFMSFLMAEKSEGSFEKIEKFIQLLQNGKDWKEAGISIFRVDLRKLENEYFQFLKKPKFLTIDNFATDSFVKDFQVSSISEAKSLAVVGDFLYHSNQLKKAAEFLEESLKLDQKQTLALTTLALVKAKELYYSEAESLAENAVQIEPNNFLNHYRLAVVLSKRGMTEYGFVSGYGRDLADKMRESLIKAIDLNPNFAESYSLLVFVNYVRNEISDESFELIKNALQIAPGNQKYLLRLAEINLRKENFIEARRLVLKVLQTSENEQMHLYSKNTLQRIDSTEYQLLKFRDPNAKFVNDDTVTDEPLSEDEIKKLREKAIVDQIKRVLRKPIFDETRILAGLVKIECGKEEISFIFRNQTDLLKLSAKSFSDIFLLSFTEEMSYFRLGCGIVAKENNASIIFRKRNDSIKSNELISIEFVPKNFRF